MVQRRLLRLAAATTTLPVVHSEVRALQMSQLWRQGVVRPHTSDAARDIWSADGDDNTPVDYLPIDESLFSYLVDSRLFDDLNNACGTMIGDYEEDGLTGDLLTAGIVIINRHAASPECPTDCRDFLRSLAAMAQAACETQTELIFIL